ncbi:ATP-binding protein [Gammaproteobacteria bacterium]|nr:ATP-binding protein [Gammaproteobacteria bacterium]
MTDSIQADADAGIVDQSRFNLWNDPARVAKGCQALTLCLLLAIVFFVASVTDFWKTSREDYLRLGASNQANILAAFNRYYTERLRGKTDVLPATATIDFAKFLTEGSADTEFRLVSDYAFPSRGDYSLNRFDRDALSTMRSQSLDAVQDVREFDGRLEINHAVSLRMQPSCVDCHNSRADSPHREWKVGDVRGLIVATQKVDASSFSVLERALNPLLSGGLVFLFGGMLVVGLLRRNRLAFDQVRFSAAHEVERSSQLSSALQQVEQSHELIERVLESIVEGVIMCDVHGRILSVNTAACDIFGYSEEQLVHENVTRIVASSMRADHHHALQRYVETGKATIIGEKRSVRGLTRDGEEIDLDIRVNDVRRGEELFFVASLYDLTAVKAQESSLRSALEMAESSNRAKSRFLAMMSHEIRTPLNAVINLNDIVLKSDLDDEQRELIQMARDSGRSLSEIINDILDFSRIEAGGLTLNTSPTDLPKTLRSVHQLFSSTAHSKQLDLRLVIDPALPTVVSADSARLRQVIVNLIGNALKFTETGFVEVRAQNIDGQQVRIEIEDSGPGVDTSARDRLFVEFSQIDRNSHERSGLRGTGLGLAISRQLVELMGGTISMRSSPSGGSVFYFEIPLIAATATNVHEDERAGEGRLLSIDPGARVLVAEDSRTNQIVIRKLLEDCGCEIDIAEDGYSAIELAEQNPYAFVLMDVSMPGKDGNAVVRQLRDRGYDRPVIGLSAFAFTEDIERAMRAGMNGYVTKPINADSLYTEIARVIEAAADQ